MDYLGGRKCMGFRAHPYYSKDGDFLTYYFTDDECYAERLDDILTVYRSLTGNDFVGVKLKGVKYLREQLGEFSFHVNRSDGKPMLAIFFVAGGFLYATEETLDHYRR
jgi:hypothetical protein